MKNLHRELSGAAKPVPQVSVLAVPPLRNPKASDKYFRGDLKVYQLAPRNDVFHAIHPKKFPEKINFKDFFGSTRQEKWTRLVVVPDSGRKNYSHNLKN